MVKYFKPFYLSGNPTAKSLLNPNNQSGVHSLLLQVYYLHN